MPRLGYQFLHGGIDDLFDRPDPTIDDALVNVQLQELRARRGKQAEVKVQALPPDDVWVPQLFREGMPVSRIARHTRLREDQVRKILRAAGLLESNPTPAKAAAPVVPRERKRGRGLQPLRKGPLPPQLYGLPQVPTDTGVPDFERYRG